MKLSLVIPCYNEEENVKEFYRCVKGCFDGKIDTEDYEFVFVDDGSRDNTLSELRELSAAKAGNIKVISFSRNFGKEVKLHA